MNNQKKRDVKRAATVVETAETLGISQRQVQRVLAGDQENEKIINVFMHLTEGKNELLEAVKSLVPFL